MAGKTPPLAVGAFLDPLSRAVSCVTREIIRVSHDGYTAGATHAATLGQGDPVRLQGGPLALAALLQYEVVQTDDQDRGPWKVSTKAYFYNLKTADGDEIITYHWQPDGLGPGWPHLHVGTCVLRDEAPLDRRKHVPTGRIALEDVIALAIELGAKPLRDDHEQVLAASKKGFTDWRTWG